MKLKLFVGLLGLLLGFGCRVQEPIERTVGNYYLNPTVDFEQVGKVVMLELENPTLYPEQGRDFSELLADGLCKKHLFSVRYIRRDDPVWQRFDLDSIRQCTPTQLAEIRQRLGADAVVFGSLHRYASYPHLLIGLYLKMIDLRTAKILWAIEDVWDSADRATQQRIRHYFETRMRTGYEPLNWKIFETSPRYFNKFVVFEITQTLPDYQTLSPAGFSSEKKPVRNSISKISSLF